MIPTSLYRGTCALFVLLMMCHMRSVLLRRVGHGRNFCRVSSSERIAVELGFDVMVGGESVQWCGMDGLYRCFLTLLCREGAFKTVPVLSQRLTIVVSSFSAGSTYTLLLLN